MWFDLFLFSSPTPTLCGLMSRAPRSAVSWCLSYTGALLWRSARSVRGWPPRWPLPYVGKRLVQTTSEKKKKKTKSRTEHFGSRVKVRKYTHTQKGLLISSWPLFFISSLHSFSPTFPPTNEGLSVKFKALGHTFNIPRRKYICKDSFNLTTCSHLKWSLPASLAANLPPALCPSVHRLLRPDLCGLTSGAPGSPLAGPTLAPGGSSTQRRVSVITPDKRPM